MLCHPHYQHEKELSCRKKQSSSNFAPLLKRRDKNKCLRPKSRRRRNIIFGLLAKCTRILPGESLERWFSKSTCWCRLLSSARIS
jgi:hypothetical protein